MTSPNYSTWFDEASLTLSERRLLRERYTISAAKGDRIAMARMALDGITASRNDVLAELVEFLRWAADRQKERRAAE